MSQGAIWVKNEHAIRGFPNDIGLTSKRIAQGQQENPSQPIALNCLDQPLLGEKSEVWKKHLRKHNVQALLTVPVMAGGARIGAMSIASPVPKTWLEEEIALAQAVGQQVGGAVERLELLAKSQEQARQIQQIIDTVPEGVLVLDHRHSITLANPAAQSYLASLGAEHRMQATLTKLCGTPIEELLSTQQERTWRELKTEGAYARTFEIAVRPLETIARAEGWVLVMRDVTLEREEQARTQIRERLATVGQLAAGIAHDFNNIMAAILVYADLLSMEPGLSPEGLERLKTIQQQIERASELIRQILDFSRRSVLDRSPIDLLPFIKELDKLLGRVLPENIRRELEYEPGVYMVHADPTHLQQVFMNLALNARDAMPSGGVLYLSMKRIALSPFDPQPIPELSPGSWIKITIGDTGMGIPTDVLPHIFDPFFTTKPVGKGTGLGLAQVYGIIHQHGGVIDVESSSKRGTVFSIYLPKLDQPAEAKISVLPQNIKKGTGETLLLVEDDRPACQALGELLESQGYHILVAKNGLEAMQVFNEHSNLIDMIISDVVMPKMGGIELYHTIIKDQPGIKFLLMTGHPLDLQDKIPLEDCRIRRLNKPFSVHELLATLQTMLETPAPESAIMAPAHRSV
jgi:signal transduction histidine kinase/ActR/RegA family two-component response regulator